MEREKVELINFLGRGYNNAKQYWEVYDELGINRRDMRHVVEDIMLDDSPYFIGNMQDGKGYFVFDLSKADERARAYSYVKQEESRAMSRIRSLSKLKMQLVRSGYTFQRLGCGDDLRTYRENAKLTLKQVSNLTGIDVPLLSRFENNVCQPTEEQVIALSACYGVGI